MGTIVTVQARNFYYKYVCAPIIPEPPMTSRTALMYSGGVNRQLPGEARPRDAERNRDASPAMPSNSHDVTQEAAFSPEAIHAGMAVLHSP
jgi:hypothetical protein